MKPLHPTSALTKVNALAPLKVLPGEWNKHQTEMFYRLRYRPEACRKMAEAHAIQRVIAQGKIVGVVVVDEQGDLQPAIYPQRFNQQEVLHFATRLGLPVWLVEFNPASDNRSNLRTRTLLRALLPQDTAIITKRKLNAFYEAELDTRLREAHVDTILLMGFATNQCVRLTAAGGSMDRLNIGPYTDGAVDLGYTVMTCPQILRAGAASWQHTSPLIKCYSTL